MTKSGKLRADSTNGFSPNCYLCFRHKTIDKMGKGTHFFGQPVYCQQKNRLTTKNCWNELKSWRWKVYKVVWRVASKCIPSYQQTRTCLAMSGSPPRHYTVLIYRRRWQIESLFKQIKQNFPLRYFYGESSNAIKIQIWVTLIANLLMTLLQQNFYRTVKNSNIIA